MYAGETNERQPRRDQRVGVGIIGFSAGFFLHVIAMMTPYWVVLDHSNYNGLWYGCKMFSFEQDCRYIPTRNNSAEESMSLLALACCIFTLIGIAHHSWKRNRKSLLVLTGCILLSGVFALFTVILFGVKHPKYLSWSFKLDCASAAILLLSAGICVSGIGQDQYDMFS
ncbi:uncharacterized protein LOC121377629 [Gigantopelta aegis]|uniref:uncharacterized protein LOC121377629 n=1 Tax=Gigantopelta aegis TaxID=1735272 RepID=UPI001B88A620|nr:uncharacterized protein LOC121377629 [Gigantopelta aegis]XP_041361632.1 uncharacterized protein LOC121377629 [Gigantopelta aegis]